jgi:hypothetical protein
MANSVTGALCEIVATAKDSGLFRGQVQVRYNCGRVFHVNPVHLVDPKYASEIVKANKQKRSPCLATGGDDE